MKHLSMCSVILAFGGILIAQTNAPVSDTTAAVMTNANPAAGARPTEEIVIESDGPFEWDRISNTIIYRNNVRASSPQMNLTCELLQAQIQKLTNGASRRITAETNVIADFIGM